MSGQTFVPAILGFAAVLQNLSGVADASGPPPTVVWVVAAQLLLSTFLIGGVLDRLARDRAIGAGAFFAACGVYVFRFLRLSVVVGRGLRVAVHHRPRLAVRRASTRG